MIKELAGSRSEIVFVPYDEAYEEGFEDMPRRLPDLTKIQRTIGYEPSMDLFEMLERIIAYHRTMQSIPAPSFSMREAQR